jgi:hypothetical protein
MYFAALHRCGVRCHWKQIITVTHRSGCVKRVFFDTEAMIRGDFDDRRTKASKIASPKPL